MKGCRPLSNSELVDLFTDGFTGPWAVRDRALVALGMCTGYRISELLSIKVGQVYKNKVVLSHIHIEKRHMKQKRDSRTKRITPEARIYLTEWLLELKKWRNGLREDYFVFASREGGNSSITPHSANRIMKAACEKVGIVEPNRLLATHTMRKTYASRIYHYYQKEFREGNVTHDPLILTSMAMGHKSLENTMKYLSFLGEEVPDDVLRISG